MDNDYDKCPSCDGWTCGNDCLIYWRQVESGFRDELQKLHVLLHEVRTERDQAVDRAEKMHLLGLKLAREIADLERENASLRRRLREGGR